MPEIVPSPVPKVPVWARPRGDVLRDVDAGYVARAALNSLDNLVRSAPAWGDVWRQRLALKSAASATRLLGRTEEESALRDAHLFRAAGDDSGPAGKVLLAWRRLASRSTTLDEELVRHIAELLDVKWDEALADVVRNAEDLASSPPPPPKSPPSFTGCGRMPNSWHFGWLMRCWRKNFVGPYPYPC
ncbi:DUF1403 family protein [Mesorhizobium sp. CAU 1741]|uniref:DUF1403 family protein n=1 Tax=Mesorhizobium sp. CAU 1741 TaxID=3140366 RepID=UPI00325BF346